MRNLKGSIVLLLNVLIGPCRPVFAQFKPSISELKEYEGLISGFIFGKDT